jgi:hypothetical protein
MAIKRSEILRGLADKHDANKLNHMCSHYTDVYEHWFKERREDNIRLFEIGVGTSAGSLKMWQEYFPKGQVFSIDTQDKEHLSTDRIIIRRGSQADSEFLDKFIEETGAKWDYIIDDGSHKMSHHISSFEHLWTHLQPGGIYIIEDMHTCYWPHDGGGYGTPASSITYFRNLSDTVNWFYWKKQNPCHEDWDWSQPFVRDDNITEFDRTIESVTFFKGMCLIFKKEKWTQLF